MDIFCSSRFRNWLAGTLTGRLYCPCALSMAGKIRQWNTMLSFPIKWMREDSGSCQYAFQSFPLSAAHCFVAETYPMGASIHTYSFLPADPGISCGTSTPQSRSRVIARGCKPPSSHDLHWPITCVFQSAGSWCSTPSSTPVSTQVRNHDSYLSSGRYQCLVLRNSGLVPVMVDTGLISSSGLRDEPQRSHWSP